MKTFDFEFLIIEKLFPFYFVVNAQGELVKGGPSIKKLLGLGNENPSFDRILKIARPANTQFSDLISGSQGELIVLKTIVPRAELMGQIIRLGERPYWVFVMNLVVQDADELTGLGLDFNDFAIQDPIFDFLMLLQTQRRAIKSANDANQKIAEAHKIAVQASETKSRFLANMSHELRTPMNGILGMAGILLDTELNDEQRDYVKTLITSSESMLTLVNDILDLSKVEAGFINLEYSTVNLAELTEEIVNTVHPTVVRKNLDLNVSFDRDVPSYIETDRPRLRQVLINLVGNAVKFTEKGNVAISFKMHSDGGSRPQLRIAVKDSGIGMNADTIAHLFSPFVQGDDSMTKKFEGTGLGLSISKRIVDALGGEIGAMSRLGEGSEFIVFLKLKDTDISHPNLIAA